MAPADFESTLLEREKAVHAAPYQPVGSTQARMDMIVINYCLNTPGVAASIEADVSELSCHFHSTSINLIFIPRVTFTHFFHLRPPEGGQGDMEWGW